MKGELGMFLLGAAAGWFASRLLFTAPDSACCATVARGVRGQVQSSLGSGAAALGDALGLWGPAAGLVSNLGL